MIGSSVGRIVDIAGRSLAKSNPGAQGHLVFGPYMPLPPGVYRSTFAVGMAGEAPADQPAVVLDVVADEGRVELARMALRTPDFSGNLKHFTLLFEVRDMCRVEFRIFTTGSVEIVAEPEPVLTRVSGILDTAPQADLGALAIDLPRFAEDTRRILRPLSPLSLQGVEKVRLGREADGGYTCPDDFDGIDTAFSFGINDDISWDLSAADRGLTIHQFDHTVSDPAPDDDRMHFTPKMIARHSGPNSQSLSDLIRAHDAGAVRPNLILKMDIEGAEWDVFDETPEEELARLRWIVCELHYFQGLAQRDYRGAIDRSLAKLGRQFAVVHIHSNVYGGYSNFANTIVPNVLEATLVNRAYYDFGPNDQTYPADIDQSCDPTQPDFYLGTFRF